MNKINGYIQGLYPDKSIITKEEYEKNTNYRFYCPVIDTTIAKFLDIFITALRPKQVLELGTSIGYSTTVMACAVKDFGGSLTTIELDKRVAKIAKDNFEKYGVTDVINLINDDAIKILSKLNTKYDLIFLDLYNQLYPDVLDDCLKLLNPGGVMIADDTLFPVVKNEKTFYESNQKVQSFNERIAKNELIDSYILPLDDGITIVVKK